jgi:hypothetical protein
MANNFTTSVEQSKRLLELGVNPHTAKAIHRQSVIGEAYRLENSEYTQEVEKFKLYYTGDALKKKIIPAWSLNDLIEVIHSFLSSSDVGASTFMVKVDGIYCYEASSDSYIETGRQPGETLIDTAVRLIEKLKEKGLII